MLTLRVENFTDLAVFECKGRIVHSDDVFKLRDGVQSQDAARVIVLDLSEVEAIGGGGLGMLAFLEHWAREQHIRLKLFCLSESVVEGLAQTRSLPRFEIATFQGMMDLLTQFNQRDDECTVAAECGVPENCGISRGASWGTRRQVTQGIKAGPFGANRTGVSAPGDISPKTQAEAQAAFVS